MYGAALEGWAVAEVAGGSAATPPGRLHRQPIRPHLTPHPVQPANQTAPPANAVVTLHDMKIDSQRINFDTFRFLAILSKFVPTLLVVKR